MKIHEYTYKYKCGCAKKTLYSRGATKAEIKNQQMWNLTKNCPNCEAKQACCNGQRYKTVNGYEWKFERRNDLLESHV